MAAMNLKALQKAFDSKTRQERGLVLLAVVVVLVYAWVNFFYLPAQQKQVNLERQIVGTNGQIIEEAGRQADVKKSYTNDPNSFARSRQRELREKNSETDRKLDDLYGQLIDPREMSLMLTRILQRETTLKLVSLENQNSELLLTTTIDTGGAGTGDNTVQVYKHGLVMAFEGDYLETIRYLRSLEQLKNNFFWDGLEYEVTGYPNARIKLSIYTLSTQQGWIGV